MTEKKRSRKPTQVKNLDELIRKANQKVKKPQNEFKPHVSADKAGVPVDYEFRIRDEKTEVSSITQIPEFREVTKRLERQDKKILQEVGGKKSRKKSAKTGKDKRAVEALPQILTNATSFDAAVLTLASLIEGESESSSTDEYLKTKNFNIFDGDKENKSSRAKTSNKDHSLNWAILSVKAANIVAAKGGSNICAQAVASSVLLSGRDSAVKGLDAKQSINGAASKALKAVLESGGNKIMAKAVSRAILKDGEHILSPEYHKINRGQSSSAEFDDLSQDEQRTMLMSVIKDADDKIQRITDDVKTIEQSRLAKRKKLKTAEHKAAKQRKNLKKQLSLLEEERLELDCTLADTNIGLSFDEGSSFGRQEIRKRIKVTDQNRERLRDEMRTVSKSVQKKRKQAEKVDLMLEAKEKALKKKIKKLRNDKIRMNKMLQKIKQRIQERRKLGNVVKKETKLILSEKARLAEKLQILRVELKRNKMKKDDSEKFAAIENLNAKIGKVSKAMEKEEMERKEHLDGLVQKVENLEDERDQMLENLKEIQNFIAEREMVIENAGLDRERAEIALMEQIAAVEEERSKYLDLVQQAKQDENDRHHFEQLLLKEQAAAEKDRMRLNERIKQVQQTEAIYRKREEAFRNRILTANLEIMTEWKEQQRVESEYNEGKKVAFKLDEDEISEMTPEKNIDDLGSEGSFSSDEDEDSEGSFSSDGEDHDDDDDDDDDDDSSLSSFDNEEDSRKDRVTKFNNENKNDGVKEIDDDDEERGDNDDKAAEEGSFDDGGSTLGEDVESNRREFTGAEVLRFKRNKPEELGMRKSYSQGEEGIEIVYSMSVGDDELTTTTSFSRESCEVSISNSLSTLSPTNNGVENIDENTAHLSTIHEDYGNFSESFEDDWFENVSLWDEQHRAELEKSMAAIELENSRHEMIDDPVTPKNYEEKEEQQIPKKTGGGLRFGKFTFKKKQPVRDTTENFRLREIAARNNMKQKKPDRGRIIPRAFAPMKTRPQAQGMNRPLQKKKFAMKLFGREKLVEKN